MLRITIPGTGERWDERNQVFLPPSKPVTLQLEHSLVSVSRWESKWHFAFLSKREKTQEQIIDYIRCMTLNRDVDPDIYYNLTSENFAAIDAYIENPMTATHFVDEKIRGRSLDTVTSELIYYWMISLGIPFECQKWHLNRLISLIKVCSKKNAPPKKVNKADIARRYAELNAARRKKHNTKG